MKLKTFIPAILAGVLGLGAAYLVRNAMIKGKTVVVESPKTVQAVVSKGKLIAGQTVTADDITFTTVPAPEKPGEFVTNPTDVLGRVLNAPTVEGQVITTASIAPRGAAPTLPSLIPPGMRAITVVVDETNSFSGMLVPGCHVDVVGTFSNGKSSLTRTIIKNVYVQAVGQRLTSARPEDGKEPAPFHTATLIVTAHEAQLIDLANSSAKMRFILKGLNKGTDAEVEAGTVTVAELQGKTDEDSGSTPTATPAIASGAPTTQPSYVATTADVTAIPAPTTNKHTVELINGPGSAPIRLTFDLPQTAQVGGNDILEKSIPGSDAEPRD